MEAENSKNESYYAQTRSSLDSKYPTFNSASQSGERDSKKKSNRRELLEIWKKTKQSNQSKSKDNANYKKSTSTLKFEDILRNPQIKLPFNIENHQNESSSMHKNQNRFHPTPNKYYKNHSARDFNSDCELMSTTSFHSANIYYAGRSDDIIPEMSLDLSIIQEKNQDNHFDNYCINDNKEGEVPTEVKIYPDTKILSQSQVYDFHQQNDQVNPTNKEINTQIQNDTCLKNQVCDSQKQNALLDPINQENEIQIQNDLSSKNKENEIQNQNNPINSLNHENDYQIQYNIGFINQDDDVKNQNDIINPESQENNMQRENNCVNHPDQFTNIKESFTGNSNIECFINPGNCVHDDNLNENADKMQIYDIIYTAKIAINSNKIDNNTDIDPCIEINKKIDELYCQLNEDKVICEQQFKNLFRKDDQMSHITFEEVIPQTLDDIGRKLMGNHKLWLLWIKIIENKVKISEMSALLEKAVTYNLDHDTEIRIKLAESLKKLKVETCNNETDPKETEPKDSLHQNLEGQVKIDDANSLYQPSVVTTCQSTMIEKGISDNHYINEASFSFHNNPQLKSSTDESSSRSQNDIKVLEEKPLIKNIEIDSGSNSHLIAKFENSLEEERKDVYDPHSNEFKLEINEDTGKFGIMPNENLARSMTKKKRKLCENDQELHQEKPSAKKIMMNEYHEKNDKSEVININLDYLKLPEKKHILLNGNDQVERKSPRKKNVFTKSQHTPLSKKKSKHRTSVSPLKNIDMSIFDQLGSGLTFQVVPANKLQKDKYGVDKIITPIRTSRRLNSKIITQSINKGTKNIIDSNNDNTKKTHDKDSRTSLSVKFLEDSEDYVYLSNQEVERFHAVDEESARIKEFIKKRIPTPFSKSTNKDQDFDEIDDYNPQDQNNQTILQNDDNLVGNQDESFKVSKLEHNSGNQDPSEDSNKIDITKVLDPDLFGHGNYAVIELGEKSAKKIGAKRAVTPLKSIDVRDRIQAYEDIRSLKKSDENIEDVAYLPRSPEVTKIISMFGSGDNISKKLAFGEDKKK